MNARPSPIRIALRAGMFAVACGHAAAADDLLAVYQRARAQDPVFRAAQLQRDAAAEKLPQARAALLPGVSLKAGGNRQLGEASFDAAPFTGRSARSWNWNLQLTQPLWNGALWAANAQAGVQVRLSQEQFRQAGQDLLLRVAQAYFDALVATESARVAQAQVAAVQQQLALAQRNFDVGMTTVTDLHEARSRYDLARAQQVAARTELDNREAELQKLLGEPAVSLAPLLPLLPLLPLSSPAGPRAQAAVPALNPSDAQSWLQAGLERNPQVCIQQLAVEVARQELRRAEAGHGPSLELTAGYGGNFSKGSLSTPSEVAARSRATQVGLQLSVPLYAGGGTSARVREAATLLAKAQEDTEAARRQAASQVRQAFAGVRNGQAQVDALASAVASSRASLDATQVGYRIGTRINVDVLNAQQQLYAAQRDLYRARADVLMHTLRLKAAAGSLQEGDLAAMSGLFDNSTPPTP